MDRQLSACKHRNGYEVPILGSMVNKKAIKAYIVKWNISHTLVADQQFSKEKLVVLIVKGKGDELAFSTLNMCIYTAYTWI